MSKRRKVRWIVGGVLSFVVLYSATAFAVSWNSPNAKLDRALNQIIAEYDFEYKGERLELWAEVLDITPTPSSIRYDIFDGEALDDEDKERIDEIILAACPPGTIDSGPPISYCSFGSLSRAATQRYLPERLEIQEITFEFNNKEGDEEGLRSSTLLVRRDTSASPVSLLENLWPW